MDWQWNQLTRSRKTRGPICWLLGTLSVLGSGHICNNKYSQQVSILDTYVETVAKGLRKGWVWIAHFFFKFHLVIWNQERGPECHSCEFIEHRWVNCGIVLCVCFPWNLKLPKRIVFSILLPKSPWALSPRVIGRYSLERHFSKNQTDYFGKKGLCQNQPVDNVLKLGSNKLSGDLKINLLHQ